MANHTRIRRSRLLKMLPEVEEPTLGYALALVWCLPKTTTRRYARYNLRMQVDDVDELYQYLLDSKYVGVKNGFLTLTGKGMKLASKYIKGDVA